MFMNCENPGARTLFGRHIPNESGMSVWDRGCKWFRKSTLLKILTGEEEASGGAVQIPKRLRLGVLAQDHFEFEEKRILDVVMMGHEILWDTLQERSHSRSCTRAF